MQGIIIVRRVYLVPGSRAILTVSAYVSRFSPPAAGHVGVSGVFRGVDMERCPPPSGRRLIFSACVNLYRKNNGLFACESSLKKSRILSITATETLNSITNLIVTSLVTKIVVVIFKILVNSRKLGFTFFMFSIFLCF